MGAVWPSVPLDAAVLATVRSIDIASDVYAILRQAISERLDIQQLTQEFGKTGLWQAFDVFAANLEWKRPVASPARDGPSNSLDSVWLSDEYA